ncbi:MFS transporter [Brachybacterium sp. P6-10-X1]|uniref:MFS transporter n=1 Tax=Brachybacterium sp. P6-10-X1 TaxID=1903186 RepID=UPI0009F9959D|nr:MFS transporter [Brachybacterium sp. P6-10-X1]
MPVSSMGRTPAGRPQTLLRDRRIALVWTAGLIAWIGSHAMFVVLPFVVFDSTSSPGATALTVLASALPPVLLGQFAGVVTDRADRRRVLLGANLALAVLTIGLLFIGDWGWIAVLSFARSCVAQLVGPAEHALLPELAPNDRLGELASLNTLNNTLARLVGPAFGGILLAAAGFSGVVWLVVVCHALCAVLVFAVDHRSPWTESDQAGPGMLAQWREGARIARQQPVLRVLMPLVVMMAWGEGFVSALLAPFTRELLNAGPDVLGWILSAQAVGGVFGALWSTRVADRRPPFHLLAVAALVAGILLLVVFTYPLGYQAVWPAVALTTLAGAPFAVVAAMQGTLLQTQSPPAARGRVFSLFWGVTSLAQLLGIGLAGVLAERFGSVVVVLDGVGYVIAGLAGLAAARRINW